MGEEEGEKLDTLTTPFERLKFYVRRKSRNHGKPANRSTSALTALAQLLLRFRNSLVIGLTAVLDAS